MGGLFFCKKVDLSHNAGQIMYSICIFILHFTFFAGCVRAQRTPPPAYGPKDFRNVGIHSRYRPVVHAACT